MTLWAGLDWKCRRVSEWSIRDDLLASRFCSGCETHESDRLMDLGVERAFI